MTAVRFLGVCLAIVGVAVFTAGFAACGSGDMPRTSTPVTSAIHEQLFNNFKKAVSSANADGYAPYWLGRGFEAGGIMFAGPDVDGDFRGKSGGGVRFGYSGSSVPPHGLATLYFDEYSAKAWSAEVAFYAKMGGDDVMVAGHQAKVVHEKNDAGRTVALLVIVPIDETTIVATAESLKDLASTAAVVPEGNPLMDQSAFLAVMQNLRPYPQ
jgi:hypothetical protein